MTPEDPILKQAGLNIARKLAEKYRSLDALSKVPMGDCQQGLSLLADLIGYIDDLERDRIAYRNLGSKIEELETTIEALKEKLVEERAWWIFATSPDGLNDDFLRRFRMESEGDFDLSWINDARHQLKADPDLMGVEWE